MFISSRLIVFASVLFLVGCSSGYKSEPDQTSKSEIKLNNQEHGSLKEKSKYNELTFSFKDCMQYVHTTRGQGDIPPALGFIRDISQSIFSCEYFRGKPIRSYGVFGPKLKINGNVVYSGWGYAITDKPYTLSELLNAPNFAERYKSSGNIKVTVKEEPIFTENMYSRVFKTYFVRVSSQYFSTRNVAALGVFDFSRNRQDYRLFLWVQDHILTKYEVTKRFNALISIVSVPLIGVASK
ncbi:MAG TPA: hypothetical protein ENI63_00480 [Candidatus Kaiserbacteria bacterium]|nr:hypothetical protein [Candidatus Kaiserbacteria bacterium]